GIRCRPDEGCPMIDTAKLWLRGYLGCVYAAGIAAVGWVVTVARWDMSAYVLSLVVVVAILMIASEFTPIRVWNRGRFQEYTFSGAFAVVLLQIAPLEWAVLPQAVAVLVEEVRQRRPPKVAAFNVAQNVLMFVLARLAMNVVEGTAHDASQQRQLAALVLGAGVYFVVNNVLTGAILGLTSGTGVLRSIVAGMRREIPVTPIV